MFNKLATTRNVGGYCNRISSLSRSLWNASTGSNGSNNVLHDHDDNDKQLSHMLRWKDCILEEVQGQALTRGAKYRFLVEHAHARNCYAYGLLLRVDHDIDFPEPMPVVENPSKHDGISLAIPVEVSPKEVESAVTIICHDFITELKRKNIVSDLTEIKWFHISSWELPPLWTAGSSTVYVMLRPDKKLYVGKTNNLMQQVCAHRCKDGMDDASFLYLPDLGKSLARQVKTLLINQLPNRGFVLTNVAGVKKVKRRRRRKQKQA